MLVGMELQEVAHTHTHNKKKQKKPTGCVKRGRGEEGGWGGGGMGGGGKKGRGQGADSWMDKAGRGLIVQGLRLRVRILRSRNWVSPLTL